jgi:preprotein translocase subunit SecG
MNKEEKEHLKDIEYYSNLVNAHINTSMEIDKSILALSSGAIGILVTFNDYMNITNYIELTLYIFSLFLFTTTIICVLIIFKKNKKYIESLIQNNDNESIKNECLLNFLDKTAHILFILGIILSIILGITLTNKKIKENTMEQNNKQKIMLEIELDNLNQVKNLDVGNESVVGIANLKPNLTSDIINTGKSINGLRAIRPSTNTKDDNSKNNQK